MDRKGQTQMSGILEKRRQNLKFQWRTYQFILNGTKLSYFKMRGSHDKEGELWGTIDVRDVLTLVSAATSGSRHILEMTLRNGKIILLAAGSSEERTRWLQAIQETMVSIRKSRRSSDTPVVREKQSDLSRDLRDWMTKSNPGSDVRGPVDSEATEEVRDLDSFIDQTFSGITFNRESQLRRQSTGTDQDAESSSYKT
ncbi:uncharacterized protein LOC143785398 isoform X1 [Ranitomeya variabilis]|uniref:uncharacterized protein LOC143785398 isoform X1 n=1 Tax=Ranitomeya variabilis TaxID=490064 RepID=UPI004056D3DE